MALSIMMLVIQVVDMKKTITKLLLPLIFLTTLVTPVQAVGKYYKIDLIAAQDTYVGYVVITTSATSLTVTFVVTEDDWELLETHVYVGIVEPEKHSPGKFNSSNGEGVPVSSGTVYIAAHAELGMIDPISGEPILDEVTGEQITETSWAQNEDFTDDTLFRSTGKGSYWATYFTITAP